MKKTILDINDYLKNKTFNLDNNFILDKKTNTKINVLNANKRQLIDLNKTYNFCNLLTLNSSKLEKSKKILNINTVGLSLAPHTTNKIDELKLFIDLNKLINKQKNQIITLCGNSNKHCRVNCVSFECGNPAYEKNKKNAMYNRKLFFLNDTQLFLANFIRHLTLYSDYCINNNLIMSVRPNISSDINYENIKVIYQNKLTTMDKIIFNIVNKTDRLKDFKPIPYDYTKNYNRKQSSIYHKVFSYGTNDIEKPLQAIKNGLSLAIVVNVARNKPLPKTIKIKDKILNAFDGDTIDYLPHWKRKKPSAILLRFKYRAKWNKQKRKIELQKAINGGFVKDINTL